MLIHTYTNVLLLITTSFGPLGVVQLSEWSQTHRLEQILKKNNILINGKISKVIDNRDIQEINNISSIISYLVNTKKIGKLKKWFSDLPDAEINKAPNIVTAAEILQDMRITDFAGKNANVRE